MQSDISATAAATVGLSVDPRRGARGQREVSRSVLRGVTTRERLRAAAGKPS